MVLRFFLLAGIFLFVCCTQMGERNNPYDPESPSYIGKELPSSSSVVPVVPVPSSSSKPSSSSSVAPVVPSSSSVPTQTGTIKDTPVTYQGETYQTVKIGTQTWMARNLNYAVEGSKCDGDDDKLKDENTSNCETYGRFYNWATAMTLPASCNSMSCASQVGAKHQGICPNGWHIPSDDDWSVLMKFVNPSCFGNNDCDGAGTKLKAATGWNPSDNDTPVGTNNYGFSALPGGCGIILDGNSDGNSSDVGYRGFWWSSSEAYNSEEASLWKMDYNDEVVREGNGDKSSFLFSVRCVKD